MAKQLLKSNAFKCSNDIYTKGTPSQIDESVAFTQAVKDKYPNSKFHSGAHSLGGYLAQYNAVKFNFDSTTTYAARTLMVHFLVISRSKLMKESIMGKSKM